MLQDSRFVAFAKRIEQSQTGEIGMHLHAWSTPPEYNLCTVGGGSGQPYLIEYPVEIMERKIAEMTSIINEKIGISPVSHRAGRWAMNDSYVELLKKYGYKVDCSVTPHISWAGCEGQTYGSKGSDYSTFCEEPYYWNGLLEVPVTVRCSHSYFSPYNKNARGYASSFYRIIKGKSIWLRPTGHNLSEMLWLLKNISKSESGYIMFMLHSSEMMPGGSPTFQTEESIEKMYEDIKTVFSEACKYFEGETLRDYVSNNFVSNNLNMGVV